MPPERLLLSGLFGLGDGGEEAEKSLDTGDFEGVVDALVDGDKREAAAVFLTGDVGSDHGTDAGGVGQGHVGEIQDEGAGGVGAKFGLKSKDIGEGQGAGKVPDLNSFARSGSLFNIQGWVRHAENGNGE